MPLPLRFPSFHGCVLFTIVIASTLGSSPLAYAESPCCASTSDLRRLTADQLDHVFAQGRVDDLPVGTIHGTVLLQTDARLPRLRRLENIVWKGKVFDPDGQFINQWAGCRAVTSCVASGQSWYDGRPCLVLEYPPQRSRIFQHPRRTA